MFNVSNFTKIILVKKNSIKLVQVYEYVFIKSINTEFYLRIIIKEAITIYILVFIYFFYY